MTNTKETTVHRQVLIEAPVAAVWNTLNNNGLSSFLLLRELGDPRLKEGNRLAWHDPERPDSPPRITGRVMVVAPQRRITLMTYLPGGGLPDEPENYTSVEIRLEPEEGGRTSVLVEEGDYAKHPFGPRLAKQAGDRWVEALIRLKDRVEHRAAA